MGLGASSHGRVALRELGSDDHLKNPQSLVELGPDYLSENYYEGDDDNFFTGRWAGKWDKQISRGAP